MTEPVFLLGLGIAGSTLVMIVRTIAGAFNNRGLSGRDASQLQERLDDAHAELANQAAQIAELQERVDFAERLIARSRDKPTLGPGDKAG